jgi:hypothetical protein
MSSSLNEPSLSLRVLDMKTGAVSIKEVLLSKITFHSHSVSELTDSQVERLTRLYQKVGYVIDRTLENWIKDFTYDLHPERAHIIPYLGTKTDHPSNGLLLRVDVHKLFDAHYLSINPETNKVEISQVLKNTSYEKLAGQPLRMPKSKTERPNPKALLKHYQIFSGC